jgi:D-serine deaminase-like pyridoxal phosphate-dependent protein
MQNDWYWFKEAKEVPTPALLVYPERIQSNIAKMLRITGSPKKLMPHVKTHKMEAVVKMQLEAGIIRFKCATIAEAEMTARAGASQVLLAYPLNGPNAKRYFKLSLHFPETAFLTLVDSVEGASNLATIFAEKGKKADVLIDVNVGMNRTGVHSKNLLKTFEEFAQIEGIEVKGFHAYDGHIHDNNRNERFAKAKDAIAPIIEVQEKLENGKAMMLVAGGTCTFPFYAQLDKVYCSPGTNLLWDEGYRRSFPDLDFDIAALLLTRVVSQPQKNTYCLDLGYKAIAAENPLPRLVFLNLPNAKVLFQSEEHLVIKSNNALEIGAILFAAPIHICPSVACYSEALVIESKELKTTWQVTAQNHRITI